MDIKEQKYIDIAKKLLQKSKRCRYTVISNSMNPLINKGDKIVCVKCDFEKLKKYTIIAFKNDTLGNENLPTIHRIINKVIEYELCYQTKGDNSLYSDIELVKKEQFIGIVEQIIKQNITIDLNTKIGKTLSMFAYFLFYIKNIFRLLFVNIKKFFIMVFQKENKIEYNADMLILRQSILTKAKDWKSIVENGIKLVAPFIDKNKKVCDLSFGGGYCEQSFNFIRIGIEIEYKNLGNKDKNDFDVIICSRIINIVESPQKRKEIYDSLKFFLKQDGIVLLSYINEDNNFFIKLKRKIYKKILKKYDGPLSDDLVYENKYFVMKNICFKNICRELIGNGFEIKKYIKAGKTVSLLISQKIWLF